MLNKDMVILDIVERFPQTETVFHRYDEAAGVCILCQHLFDNLETVSFTYGFDIAQMLKELNRICINEN